MGVCNWETAGLHVCVWASECVYVVWELLLCNTLALVFCHVIKLSLSSNYKKYHLMIQWTRNHIQITQLWFCSFWDIVEKKNDSL